MKIGKEALVLYSIHLIVGEESHGGPYTTLHLSGAMGISESTLDLYLSRLTKRGLITRKKLRYEKDIGRKIFLTDSGREEVGKVEELLGSLLLTTERHLVPTCIRVVGILEKIPDPLERIFFLSVYDKNKRFDLPMFLETLRLSKQEINLIHILADRGMDSGGTGRTTFIEAFFNTSLYGDLEKDILERDIWKEKDIDALLILAEAKQRSGQFQESLSLHEYILSPRFKITQNQWFKARIDQAQTHRKMGDTDESLRILDEVLDQVDDKIYLAYAKEVKAKVYSHMGEYERAIELFRSSIGAFKTFGLPLMLSIAINNRGVLYFSMNEFDLAEKEWIKARRLAKEARSDFAEAIVLPNLADLAARSGNFDLSKNYLSRAYGIFEGLGDVEGLAAVEFNLSLMYLEMRNDEEAVSHFKLSESIAYPLPSPHERMERRKDFIGRANRYGLEDVGNLI